jgi:hypothetical protein
MRCTSGQVANDLCAGCKASGMGVADGRWQDGPEILINSAVMDLFNESYKEPMDLVLQERQ